MTLSNIIDGTDYSAGEIFINSFYDSVTSAAAGKLLKVPGINSGKVNNGNIYVEGLNKMRQTIVKSSAFNMSLKTMSKGLGSIIVSSIPMDIFYGVKFANYKRARMEILLPMMYGSNNGGENGQYITAR